MKSEYQQALDPDGWYVLGAGRHWNERTHRDGGRVISLATNDEWHHEELYRTARGTWILHAWTPWECDGETWSPITPREAAVWLLRSKHRLLEELYEITAAAAAAAGPTTPTTAPPPDHARQSVLQ